jgi:hypothetical protein
VASWIAVKLWRDMWLTDIFFYFTAGDELREPPSFHDEMEKRLKMDF